MHRIRKAFLAVLMGGLLVAAPSRAQSDPETVADLVAAVEATYSEVSSLRADFVQIQRSTTIGGESRQKGRVMLKRPRKMRWDFVQPDDRQFVTDGSTMWIWSSADNQVIVSTEVGAGTGMTQLLDDLNNLDELFEVTLLDRAGGAAKASYVLELKPKKDQGFKKLRLVVARKKYTVEQVVVIDQFDNEVELSFTQVKMNPELPDNLFVFEIPAGAQVIRTDGM